MAKQLQVRDSVTAAAPAMGGDGALLDRLHAYARHAEGAISPHTARAIRADTAVFAAWCALEGCASLAATPETVAAFIDAQAAGKAVATVRRYVASIAHLHRAAGLANPAADSIVRLALRRLARTKGTRQKQAEPITEATVAKILDAVGDDPIGLRDVALLLVCRDTLARRSELIAFTVADVQHGEDGAGSILIRRSKTDAEGQGSVRFLSPRTMAALRRWQERAALGEGPLFRSVGKGGRVTDQALCGNDVARIFKKLAVRAGVDPAGISGHSCRVGMSQDLIAAGIDLAALQQAGGWKSPAMPARYGERLLVRRGAVATYYRRQGAY